MPTEPRFKTLPRGKQWDVIRDSALISNYALLCRPGTGKTKLGLDTASINFSHDRIDALLVIAPEGVDRQWIDEGVPKHLSDDTPRMCGNYRSKMGKQAYEALERMVKSKEKFLKVVTLSFDGIQTPRGRKLAQYLVTNFRCMVFVDEAHRVSNTKSAVFKAVKPIVRAARVKRIATGTLVRQNPFSAYGQFDLMGDSMLGFSSLTSFKSMYAAVLGPNDPLVRAIGIKLNRRDKFDRLIMPKGIIAKDDDDRPIYRNLADLRKRLGVHSAFLTLADVNGAEPVVNQDTIYVRLEAEQQVLYDQLVKYGVAQAPGGQLTTEGTLALAIRLAQVAGGFAPSDDDSRPKPVCQVNPKLAALLELTEQELIGEKVVIWAKFSAELDAIVMGLREKFGTDSVVEYHGRMESHQKDLSKRRFIEKPGCRFFVGQQKAGGTGLDGLQTVASYMVFYSNDYPYLDRLQAISRLARTDGCTTIQVYDLVAEDTIDEAVTRCLRTAQDVSDSVLKRAIIKKWE